MNTEKNNPPVDWPAPSAASNESNNTPQGWTPPVSDLQSLTARTSQLELVMLFFIQKFGVTPREVNAFSEEMASRATARTSGTQAPGPVMR